MGSGLHTTGSHFICPSDPHLWNIQRISVSSDKNKQVLKDSVEETFEQEEKKLRFTERKNTGILLYGQISKGLNKRFYNQRVLMNIALYKDTDEKRIE